MRMNPGRRVSDKTTERRENGLGVAGFVSGLLALVSVAFLIFNAGVVLAILAIVLGAIGWRRGVAGAPYRRLSLAGVILGILSVLGIFLLLFGSA
jgi:hypothetical protein